MARDVLTYASGNSASTTLASGISNTDTSVPLTSDTNFAAESGEGMVIIDEGTASEELAYATGKVSSDLTTPLANRGLEGTSATSHSSGASVKGILTAGMWNDMIDALCNVVVKATGAVDTTKVITHAGTQTLTNKRVTKRTGTVASSATPTINTDNVDFFSITALAANITSMTTNLSGTPTEGQTLWLAITGTATRTISWGASFESSTVTLPATTVSTDRLDVGLVWNSVTSKWRCVAAS